MSSSHVRAARRNAYVFGATGVTLGLLAPYPTSTNSSPQGRPRQAAAPVGIVTNVNTNPNTNPLATPRATLSPSVPSDLPATPVAASTAVVVVNGSSADTQYGPVQVQLKIRSGRILSATAIDYPQGSQTDQDINSQAIPILQHETVQAQSAHIDTVSGATFTSGGYLQSLQAALDAAHLH
jgi:uncharacterized protein with FMN-binding domain